MRNMKKLKNQSGFSLAETLLAVLILLLVSMLMANGIPVVRTVYKNVTVGANARVLLSTTISALRNELGTAKDIVVDSSGMSVSYYSVDTHATSTIYLNGEPGKKPTIMIREYTDDGVYSGTTDTRRNLVSHSAANKDLYVTYTGITAGTGINKDIVTFNGLQVKRESKDEVMTDPIDLTVRTIIGSVS